METLFQDKYRIKSNRRPFWDYSGFGWYFITICTQNMEHYFGTIVDDKMKLNELGKIVNDELLKTAQIRENVQLDEFIVMPNHVHVIIIFDPPRPVETTRWGGSKPEKEMTHRVISTLKKNSVGSIIGQFKPTATKRIRKINPLFQWQSNYYDHIIRDDNDLKRIRRYIDENPQNWDRDRNNPEGLFM